MSVTLRQAPPAPRRIGLALAGTALVLAALGAAWAAPWIEPGALGTRALQPMAPAPGTDLTLLLAGWLPLAPEPALWAASWFAGPLLLCAALAAGHARPLAGAAVGLAACLNPLALHAMSSGWGLGAPALFVLTTQLIALPGRPHHRGLPLLGVALTLAAAGVPGARGLGLPVFAVLWLAAPRPWRGGTMRALYLTAFFLPAAWLATMAYLAWLSGAPSPAPAPGGAEDAWHLALGVTLATACAPGLAVAAPRRLEAVAVLGLSALAFVAPGVPDGLAVFVAWSGQAADALRRGGAGPLWALTAGTLASGGAVWLLA